MIYVYSYFTTSDHRYRIHSNYYMFFEDSGTIRHQRAHAMSSLITSIFSSYEALEGALLNLPMFSNRNRDTLIICEPEEFVELDQYTLNPHAY